MAGVSAAQTSTVVCIIGNIHVRMPECAQCPLCVDTQCTPHGSILSDPVPAFPQAGAAAPAQQHTRPAQSSAATSQYTARVGAAEGRQLRSNAASPCFFVRYLHSDTVTVSMRVVGGCESVSNAGSVVWARPSESGSEQ